MESGTENPAKESDFGTYVYVSPVVFPGAPAMAVWEDDGPFCEYKTDCSLFKYGLICHKPFVWLEIRLYDGLAVAIDKNAFYCDISRQPMTIL